MISRKRLVFSLSALFGALLFLSVKPLVGQEMLIMPYLQPGSESTMTDHDSKMVVWMTTEEPGEFQVEYHCSNPKGSAQIVRPEIVTLKIGKDKRYLLYRATLQSLPLDATVSYSVRSSGKTIREASFRTKKGKSYPVKFVVLGDVGEKGDEPKQVAYQMFLTDADFGLTVGDLVYVEGRLGQYLDHYVDYYINTSKASPQEGAPILASVPFYQVIGNHDVKGMDLAEYEDGMAFFYLWYPPLNGPKESSVMPGVRGSPDAVASFKEAAGANYPSGARNYSFENGPAHFLVLDANAYVNVSDPIWRAWIEKDLEGTKARWKFVFFHQPGFHSSKYHYAEQQMRALAPLFEKCGVDVVFSGHVHNYQRSKPLKFAPSENLEKMAMTFRVGRKYEVPGKFTIDENFDGVTRTIPQGVIYIVTGAGGGKLADRDFTHNPSKWRHATSGWAPYTEKFIADRHSFTEVTVSEKNMVVRQIDREGNEMDKIQITKP